MTQLTQNELFLIHGGWGLESSKQGYSDFDSSNGKPYISASSNMDINVNTDVNVNITITGNIEETVKEGLSGIAKVINAIQD